jgi:hypothetical protein
LRSLSNDPAYQTLVRLLDTAKVSIPFGAASI